MARSPKLLILTLGDDDSSPIRPHRQIGYINLSSGQKKTFIFRGDKKSVLVKDITVRSHTN